MLPSLQRHFPVALRRTGVAAGRRRTWLPRWPVWDGNPVLSRTWKSLVQKGLPSRWPPVWRCGAGWGLRTFPACSAQPGLPLCLPLWWHLVGGRGQMCPDTWRPTQGAYHSSRVLAWLHLGVCRRSRRDQLVPAWKAAGLQTMHGGWCRWHQHGVGDGPHSICSCK